MDPIKPEIKQEEQEQKKRIKDNQLGIAYQSQKSMKIVQIRAGNKFQSGPGAYRYINMVGKQWGTPIEAFNNPQQKIVILQPKATLITETLARKTQILYSMDNSAILFKLDIKPGDVVVEAGTGSGSLSCAISQSIGDSGRLYTFQFNKERAEITKQFFEKLEKKNVVCTWRDIVNDGFKIENVSFKADALFLDIPNPWAALRHVKDVLKKNGRLCCFSPCIQQVQRTCQQLRKDKYKNIQTIECLIRQFDLQKRETELDGIQIGKRLNCYSKSVHTNRGHTGFLTFAVI